MTDQPSPLRAWRDGTGLGLAGAAKLLGIDRTTLFRWEKGEVPADRLIEVERATGVSRRKLRPDLFASEAA